MSVASGVAAQTGIPTVGSAAPFIMNADSPISQLISYITTAFSWLKYFLSSITPFLAPLLLWPLPIFLYLFAPVVVFSDIVMTVFFYGPYNVIVYLLDALYPIYVLAGVACITGGIIGLAGRQLCRLSVHLLQDRDGGEDSSRKKETVKLER